MRGFLKIDKFEFSFLFDEESFTLSLVNLHQQDLLFGIILGDKLENMLEKPIRATTTDGNTVVFFANLKTYRNYDIDLNVEYYLFFENHNNSRDVHQYLFSFSGDIVDNLYSPSNAFIITKDETIEDNGKIIDITRQVKHLSTEEFTKSFDIENKIIETAKVGINKSYSSDDKNPYASYKSYLALYYREKQINFSDIRSIYLRTLNMFRFLFHKNELNFDKCHFNCYINEMESICYGYLRFNTKATKLNINRAYDFKYLNSDFANLLSGFLNDDIYLRFLDDSKKRTYNLNQMYSIFTDFEYCFTKYFPTKTRKIKQDYLELKEKVFSSLQKIGVKGKQKEYLNDYIKFIDGLDYSLKDKILYCIKELIPNHFSTPIDKSKFAEKITEFRNSLVHGRKYSYSSPIDFNDLKLFDKMIYKLVLKICQANVELVDRYDFQIYY